MAMRPALRRTRRHGWNLWLRSHGDEEASFAAQAPHPGELRHRAFDPPIVLLREELVRFSAQERAGEGPQVGEPAGAEPGAHLTQGVPVLLHVLVLVAEPGMAPRGFVLALGEHRIAGDPTVAGESRDLAARDSPAPVGSPAIRCSPSA